MPTGKLLHEYLPQSNIMEHILLSSPLKSLHFHWYIPDVQHVERLMTHAFVKLSKIGKESYGDIIFNYDKGKRRPFAI